MSLSIIGKIVPYSILKKHIIGTNPDCGILNFDKNYKFPVSVYEIENGIWIVRSSKAELESKRRLLQRKINDIDELLEMDDDDH